MALSLFSAILARAIAATSGKPSFLMLGHTSQLSKTMQLLYGMKSSQSQSNQQQQGSLHTIKCGGFTAWQLGPLRAGPGCSFCWLQLMTRLGRAELGSSLLAAPCCPTSCQEPALHGRLASIGTLANGSLGDAPGPFEGPVHMGCGGVSMLSRLDRMWGWCLINGACFCRMVTCTF